MEFIKSRHAGTMIASAIGFVALSFFRTWQGGSIMVDGHALSGIPVYIVFTGFLAFLGLYSVSLYSMWDEGTVSTADARKLAYVLAVIFSFMTPMLSNDIFSMLTYGDASNRGVDVYTDTLSLSRSPFWVLVSDLWKTAPCVYGPVSLTGSKLAGLIGGGNILLAIAAYKVIAFIWAVLFIEVAYRISALLKLTVRPFLFIVLNPVFLMQGLAQLHCDAIAIALVMCMVYFFLSGRWNIAFVFAALSIATKISFVLMLPFLVIALAVKRETWLTAIMRAAAGIAITVVTLALLYAPYYSSVKTFTTPFQFLFQQNPAKSIAEVMGDVLYFAPSIIQGDNSEVQNNIAKPSGVSDDQLKAWLHVKMACQAFAAIMSIWIFLRFWMRRREMDQWFKVFARLVLLFLLFYSHVFYAWYLMMFIPFLWYDDDKKFMQWAFVLVCFSNVHDILCAVNHATPVYYVVLPLTFLSVLVFFIRFRNNFFRSLDTASVSIS